MRVTAGRQGLGALLPPGAWHAMLAAGSVQRFDPGDVLVRQGEPGAYVLALTAGIIKVSRVEREGEEHLLAVRGPKEVVGDIAVLDGTVRSATVHALEPCITYLLSAARFRHIIARFHATDVVTRHMIGRFREAESVWSQLAELPAPDRMLRVLARFAEAVGGARPVLALSQEDLANATALSRSATTAELRELRRKGLIATGRRRIVIRDPAALRAAADPG